MTYKKIDERNGVVLELSDQLSAHNWMRVLAVRGLYDATHGHIATQRREVGEVLYGDDTPVADLQITSYLLGQYWQAAIRGLRRGDDVALTILERL